MKYKVYFNSFGKKLKMEVEAKGKQEAIWLVRNEIKILKVEEIDTRSEDETLDMLKNLFGMK